MSAHLDPSATADELRGARRLAHRLILTKPDSLGVILFKAFCRDVGAELTRRGELAPDCPFCLADLEAAAGLHHERGAVPAQLVEAAQ